ncbi:MAG: ribosome maturation factor RimP [Halieaceae bacterium]|jgi:ribosome maturation factor RimP
MIQESEIRDLIEETIEGTDIFLVELKISGGNKISVLVDAIGGLPITDCMKVSRGIDHNLDREDEDFELNVSSPGLDKPFKVFKQYEKNRGRSIHVTLEDEGVFDAKIGSVDDPKIELMVEEVITISDALEGVKKGDALELSQEDIKESKINISFN